jgi:hypothetical protein
VLIPTQTLIQMETPVDLLGRVGSTVNSASFTTQVAGLILSGVVTEHTSIRTVFALSTALLATIAIAGKLWMAPKSHTA